jgi:hypothetical protein
MNDVGRRQSLLAQQLLRVTHISRLNLPRDSSSPCVNGLIPKG